MSKKHEKQTVELTTTDIDSLPPLPKPTVRDVPITAAAPADKNPLQRESMLHSGPENLAPGTIIDDRYEVQERLGVGAMGTVFLVKHLRLGKSFALKMVNPELAQQGEFVERFKREANACSRLDHPNCISVTDFGQTPEGSLYLVMEYVAGVSLVDLVASGPIPLEEAFEYTRQILVGLDHAHRKGLIHRDIKLENVVRCSLDSDDTLLKILDFGMAKSPVRESENLKITKRGVALGTPQYMAPEQLRNQPVDERSDLYAVGVTFFRMITGTIVYEGETMMDVFANKLTKPAPSLAQMSGNEYPKALEQFIKKALERKPAERFASAAEMLTALERLKSELFGPDDADVAETAAPVEARPAQGLFSALFDHPFEDLVYWYTCGRNPKQASWKRRIVSLFRERTGKLVLVRFLIASAFVLGAGGAAALYAMNLLPPDLWQKVSAPVYALVDYVTGEQTSDGANTQGALDAPASHLTTAIVTDTAEAANASQPSTSNAATVGVTTTDASRPGEKDTDSAELMEAKQLIKKKMCGRAQQMLMEYIVETNQNPGEAYYLLARSQMCLSKWRDSLGSYKHAFEVEPRYRKDSAVSDDLKKLLAYGKARDVAFEFIEVELKKDALPMLVQLAGHEQNKQIRHPARELVESMGALSQVNMEASLDWDLHQAGTCKEKREIVQQLAALGSSRAKQVLIRAKDMKVGEGVFKKGYKHECIRQDIFEALAQMKAQDK